MKRFHVFHQIHGQTVAAIEMDEKLLMPEAGILDPETFTLRPLKNGGAYTLLPVDNEILAALADLQRNFDKLQNTPSVYFRDYIGSIDCIIESLKIFFGETKYTLVESAEDLQEIIAPKNGDKEFKEVSHSFYRELIETLQKP